VLQIGAADAVYNCAYTDVRPGRSQKVCVVCLFGKVLHKQTRFGTPEPVPWGAGKRALLETRQSCILLFQFDLISCLAKLRHDINSGGVHSCQVPCVEREFSIYTVPKRWNIPFVQHYVLITLIACGVCDFILKGFFFNLDRKHNWRCGEMQHTGISNYDAASNPRSVQGLRQAYAVFCNESLSPGNIPGTHFCSRLSQPYGHSAAGKIMSMIKWHYRKSNPRPSDL